MRTVTFDDNGQLKLGMVTDQGVVDVPAMVEMYTSSSHRGQYPMTVAALIEGGEGARQALERLYSSVQHEVSHRAETTLLFGPCVPNPEKIICVGLNYRKHAAESNMALPEAPILFSKFRNTLAGHRQELPLPKYSSQVDYEAELAIVIGKTARDVTRLEALSYVYGYCVANDLTARDLQFRSSQWLLGKTCDAFCPLGPYLVSRDEVRDPNHLRIRTFVNGELRQHSNTSDMIFYCDEIVSYCSRYMTLRPGDVILTGTPEGVILGYPEDERVWLTAGDEVVVEIEQLGILVNTLGTNDVRE